MKRTITVTYDGEAFRPQEPLDLEPNTRYRLTIEDSAPEATPEDDKPLMRILALARELDLPSDFAAQKHHYLHGHPKQ
jgi:hypothetical protein